MHKLSTIIILFITIGCSTDKLKNNLTNVDSWYLTNTKIIEGTTIRVTERKEISFRNNTFTNLVISSGDTLLFSKKDMEWDISYPNIVNYKLKDEHFFSELEIVDFTPFKLSIKGFSTRMKVDEFHPISF